MSEKIEPGQEELPRLTEDRNERERIEKMEILASVSIGGLLIGLAAALLLLLNGRIGGISGFVGGLLAPKSSDVCRHVAFVAPCSRRLGLDVGHGRRDRLQASLPFLVVAVLLIGFGTRLGSGCTIGHGICGIAHLSKRSIVARSVFFGVAILTVFFTRHVLW